MLIGLNVTSGFDSGVHEIIRLFFPQCRVTYESTVTDLQVNIKVTEGPDYLDLTGELHGMLEAKERERICPSDLVDTKREVRRFAYGLLTKATSKIASPYGILTGVRPTKLVHRYLDKGYSEGEVQRELEDNFLVNPAKARLLTEVALRNRPFLLNQEEARKHIGIYIGIPYCPSRCHYCSFPGHSLQHHPGLQEFFQILIYELSQVDRHSRNLASWLTPYISAGVPRQSWMVLNGINCWRP